MSLMDRNLSGSILILLFLFLALGCMKQGQGDCPPEYSVILSIKDKNYSNAASIPGLALRDEQLSFRQYVSNFSYRLVKLSTGITVDSITNYNIQHNNTIHTIDFSSQTPGRYVFSLFGNVGPLPENKNGILTYHLHAAGQEGEDVYFLHDTLDFGSESSQLTLPLTRTKGALFVQIENVPDSVVKIDETVLNIYRDMDENSVYSSPGVVAKSFTGNFSPEASLFTLLAPTMNGQQSILRLGFYSNTSSLPFMFIPDVLMTIKRNEILALKFSFKPEGGVEVWMSANGTWTKLHDMIIGTN